RRRNRPLDRPLHAHLRAAADGCDRARRRHHRCPSLHADLRSGGEPVMNAIVQQLVQPPLPMALDVELLGKARALATQSRRTIMAEIETLTGAGPRQVVQAVAALLGMPVA